MSINIFTIFLGISRHNFFLVWFSMEFNLLSFVAFLAIQAHKKTSLLRIKYFSVQVILSRGLILQFIFQNYFLIETQALITLLLFAKLGGAPFHSWFTRLIRKLSWFNIIWISVFQKLLPLSVLVLTINPLCSALIIIRGGAAAWIRMSQVAPKKVIASSSVFSLAWLILAISFSLRVWLHFFLVYSTLRVLLIHRFLRMGAHVAGSQKNNKKFFLWFDTLVIFSIAGLPPFLLFFIKVEILFGGLRLKLVGRRIRIILFSVILIFIYLNLIISRLTLFLDINFIQLGPQRLKKILISLTALLVLPLRLIMFSLLVTGILTSWLLSKLRLVIIKSY